MSKESIEKSLRGRFAVPPRDCQKRRIIFWQDPEQAFTEIIDEISVPGVKLLKLTGKNYFLAKKRLLEDDPVSNYLVYNPISHTDIRDNWLLDIECCSEEFRADLVSMQMDELGIDATVGNKNAMKRYARFFASKERVSRLRRFDSDYSHTIQLHLNILAVLSDTTDNTVSGILRAILSAGLGEDNPKLESIARFGSMEVLGEVIARYTGYPFAAEGSLRGLAAHLLLTAFSATAGELPLRGLEAYVLAPYGSACYTIVNEWMHSGAEDSLYRIAREIEEEFALEARFDQAELSSLMAGECFPCVDECILRRLMTEVVNGVMKPDDMIAAVEKRRTMKWYGRVCDYYEGLLQAAKMQQFRQAHADGFHFAEHQKLWKAYTSECYLMDTYYRRFYAAFGRSLRKSCTKLEDLFKGVADQVERLYKNWFLALAGGQWTALTEEKFEHSPWLPGIPRQTEFYTHEVLPLCDKGRVYVIISDALRYEAAAELTERLNAETRGNASLRAMQSALPSVTPTGMAALLPHSRLELKDGVAVTCDGMSTDSTASRERILKRADPSNMAIAYNTLLELKQSEKRARINGAKVVYIYHNQIDAVGEQQMTERQVFEACETAVSELVNLVRSITNELSGVHILITADHGFLYSHQPLKEADKADIRVTGGKIYDYDQRYLIGDATCVVEHMLRIPLDEMAPARALFVPKDAIRIKKQGGRMNYVHGGSALQELAVPVIVYKGMRSASKSFVDVSKAGLQLISQSRKVSNSSFSLDFYQKEAVGGKIVPAVYDIFLSDAAGNAVTDKQTVIADRTSVNSADRVLKVRLTLKNIALDSQTPYYLTVVEQASSCVCEQIAFSVDIAFMTDFDF